MGLAEMLIRLEIRYGSDECLKFFDQLGEVIATEAYLASADYAAEKGAVPRVRRRASCCRAAICRRCPSRCAQAVREKGLRNVTLLTVAPTGTTGTMVNTSTGIEPFFSWSYFRKSRLGVHEEQVAVVEEWQQANPGQTLPDYFVTAMELTPNEHVNVQARDPALGRLRRSPRPATCRTTTPSSRRASCTS